MACPFCGCNETYQASDPEEFLENDWMQICASCGSTFDLEDEAPDNDFY